MFTDIRSIGSKTLYFFFKSFLTTKVSKGNLKKKGVTYRPFLWKKVANMSINQLSDHIMAFVVSLKDNWPVNYEDIKQLSVHYKPIIEKIAFARSLSAFECW